MRIRPAIYILPKTHNALLAPKTFCDLCIGNWRYCRLPVFGDVARKVLAQLTGPGGGERNWQKLKCVWDGKRHSPTPEKAEKEVRIYEGHVR